MQLVAEAMRPAVTTDAWRALPPLPAETLAGLSRYDCAGAHEEALTIALLLRRKLETPGAPRSRTRSRTSPPSGGRTAPLGHRDRQFGGSAVEPHTTRRVSALVLELAASGLAPVPLLAGLKHPLAAGGLAAAAFRDLTRTLEQAILGPRPAPGFAGLRAAIAGADIKLARFADRLKSCLGTVAGSARRRLGAARRLATALEAAERLAATDTEAGAARLWREAAGDTAARFCHELIDAAGDFPITWPPLLALFEALAVGAVVGRLGRHPRLAIWALVEARLQQADLVVLGD